MTRTLLALLSLCSLAVAQDPAADVAVALLRRDAGAAARAAMVAAPAARARLQAALLPGSQRAAAMLAVAQAFPGDPEADRALVAGAAAALDGAMRGEAVPELAAWSEVERDRDADPEMLAPVVLGLCDAVAARRAVGGDPALLQEAERLLSLACVTRYGLWPVRVPVGARWQRPPGLREPLQLRLLPCEPGHLPWTKLDLPGAPAWSTILSVSGPVDLPTMPVGDWLLEAASASSPWRGVRRVLVSDLEAVALAQDGWLALAAFDPRGAAPAGWELWQNGAAVERGELAAGPVLVRLGEKTVEASGPSELRLRGERGTSWLHTRGLSHETAPSANWLVHVMVDRPVYRPGETVQGRLVLRTCRWDGEGFAQVPTTAPAIDFAVALVVHSRSTGDLRQPLRTDPNGLASFSFVVPAETAPGGNLSFTVELPEKNEKDEPLRLGSGELCGVANFRRQAVGLAVDGPESVPADAAHVDVTARAEWASGGPAAGLDVKAAINARDGWEREEAVALRTDAEGRATVRVPIASTGASWVDVDFTVTGPDGKAVSGRHRLRVVGPPDASAPAASAEAGAQALLTAAKAQDPGPDLAGELVLLAAFVAPVFIGHATPDQLYTVREWLDTERWRAAWARLPSPDRVALLGHFHKHVGDQFVPANAEEAEALWQFVLRGGNVEGAVEAMTGADPGIMCLRRHLAAGEGGEHAKRIRALVAERLGVDPDTLESNPGEEAHAVVRRLQRAGFAGEWSAANRVRLQQVRALRGVSPVGGR